MERDMVYRLKRIKTILINIAVAVIGVFLKRDPGIVILGSWNGTKFSDNSRFLYQYLFMNREKLGLRKVIWATRDPDLNKALTDLGYTSVLCGTRESVRWHLRAGTHIVCAAAFGLEDHKTDDIEVNLSWGAKKIQLWHGVGLKKTASASNAALGRKKKERSRRLETLLSRGGWNDAYVLATSKRHAQSQKAAFCLDDDRIFISCYPRNCNCLRYMEDELAVIERLHAAAGSILYVPTFRTDYSQYRHPLTYPEVQAFVRQHGYVWIEKPHAAETHRAEYDRTGIDLLELSASFDINTIYEHVSMVVSDYSSALFDAVYKHVSVGMYVPDLAVYEAGDNGLWEDPREYCRPIVAFEGSGLCALLDRQRTARFFDPETEDVYRAIRRDFYDDQGSEYEMIWQAIQALAGGIEEKR